MDAPSLKKIPTIILVEPQLGENVGMCARAIKNCGLSDLRVVAPRCAPQNEHALTAAAGARDVIEALTVYESLEDAAADIQSLYAVTARPRDMRKDVYTARSVQDALTGNVAFVFGREKAGLSNEDISRCDAIVTIPANPQYTSFNLAQAVLLVGYEWFQMLYKAPEQDDLVLAEKKEFNALINRLEGHLSDVQYFVNPDKQAVMMQNVRNIFHRAQLTSAEIEALHGIFRALKDKQKQRKSA